MMEEPDEFGDISRMHKKRVMIHAGDADLTEAGRILYVEPGWTNDDLLQAAGRRLEMSSTPKRIFNSDGMEVADVMMIEDQEAIFFTHGADYIAPSSCERGRAEGTKSNSNLPAIVGAYKVCEFLGKGGFGEVRVGQHQLTEERVALKFLRKSAIADMGAAERTTTEIQCLTALKHPNIIRLVQHINSPQSVIMVFELAEGGDLYQFLCSLPEQRVKEDDGREVCRQIISGVSYAHNQHICHRDMKLDNVLLSRPGCLREIKLADFGLSDFYRPGATMRTNCGSISYLAPEVFRGTSNAGPPLDVWSIGVILFALLCGRLPFEGTDLKGKDRPNEATIRRRILECCYMPAESLSCEAKDLLRRMFKLNPSERASLPEIFSHSWLRLRDVTSLDRQSARSDDRGNLRDAFQDGPEDNSRVGSGSSPRVSMLSRGSNSPRLAPILSGSDRAQETSSPVGKVVGAADCKAQTPSRFSRPRSSQRYVTKLNPQESKGPGQWLSDGADASGEDLSSKTVPAERERGAEWRNLQRDNNETGEEVKKGGRNRAGSGSDSDDFRVSRTGRGGLGRDFLVSVHPDRGASPKAGASGGIIRMNSRLGLTHPARSKTISGLGTPGGAANPATASCTASPRSPSPSRHQRPGTIRQMSWYTSDRSRGEDWSDQREDGSRGAPTEGGRRLARSSDEEDGEKSVRATISCSLPPLSPKKASEVTCKQGYDSERHHRERGSKTNSLRGDIGSNESASCRSPTGGEQKSPRGSVGESACSSSRLFDEAKNGDMGYLRRLEPSKREGLGR